MPKIHADGRITDVSLPAEPVKADEKPEEVERPSHGSSSTPSSRKAANSAKRT